MKNPFIVGLLIVLAVVGVFAVFNYVGTQQTVPLSEIFPEEVVPAQIEYEFATQPETVVQPQVQPAAIPVAQTVTKPIQAIASNTTSQQKTSVELTSALNQQTTTGKIPFAIQVASFKEKTKAEEALAQAQGKNYPAYLKERSLGDKGTWYRVYIGEFTTKAEADDYLTKVKADYKDSFVIAP